MKNLSALGILAAVVISIYLLQPARAAAQALPVPASTAAPAATAAPCPTPESWPNVPLDDDLLQAVITACDEYGLEPVTALAVMETESGYQADAVNGPCVGLYQINTDYAAAYTDALGVTDLAEPRQNIESGIWYLSELTGRYGDLNHALMVYNLGGKADELWRDGIHSTVYTDKVNAAIRRLEEVK